jgi:hypothetical protein
MQLHKNSVRFRHAVAQVVTTFVTLSVTNKTNQFATLSIKRSIRVSANIISGQTRIGGTMKKLSVPMIVALLLAILVVGTTLAAASARNPLPLKGSIEALETYQASGPTVFVTATGSGKATHLGRYTVSYEVEVDLPTGTGTGLSAQYVAANGDSLFAEGSGQATPTDDPSVFMVVEIYTITGGTGRFAGATGSFTETRQVNLATGVTSGTIDGNITLP